MSFSQDLENKTDIVELVSKYAKLKKAGTNYKALCPFPGHNEKTPSFVVSPSKQLAYCFGCHKWGGPLKFLMDIENGDFKEALEILGHMHGVEVQVSHKSAEEQQEIKNIYSLMKDARNFYTKRIEAHENIRQYLEERGLDYETRKAWGIGFSDSGLELHRYLKGKWHHDSILKESHIFLDVISKKDKFLNRIIYPIDNQRGDTVAFAGRIFKGEGAKYINSPASKLYDKSAILYGLHKARGEITKKDFVIVTEGYMDTISLHKYGFTNTVAVSGTAMTDKHIHMLKRLTKKIFLCFDNDKAGEKATRLSLENMKNTGLEVRIIQVAGGKDPDEFLQAWGDFQECIDASLSPIGYMIAKSDFLLTSIDDKKKLLDELLRTIKSYTDGVEQDVYIKEVAERLEMNQKTIFDQFNRLKFERQKKQLIEKTSYTSQEFLTAYIIHNPSVANTIRSALLFSNINFELESALKNTENFLENLVIDKKERLRGLALEIEEREKHETEEKKEADLLQLIQKVNTDIYKEKLSTIKERIASGKDDAAFIEYSQLIKLGKEKGLKN